MRSDGDAARERDGLLRVGDEAGDLYEPYRLCRGGDRGGEQSD